MTLPSRECIQAQIRYPGPQRFIVGLKRAVAEAVIAEMRKRGLNVHGIPPDKLDRNVRTLLEFCGDDVGNDTLLINIPYSSVRASTLTQLLEIFPSET